MSATATASADPATVRSEPSKRAVLVLGGREARRMLTHPVCVLPAGLLTLALAVGLVRTGRTGLERGRGYEVLDQVLSFGGLVTLFAVSLVATSSRRSGSEPILAATPLDPAARARAIALGVVLGPVAVASLLTLVLAWIGQGCPAAVPDPDGEGGGRDCATYSGWEYPALPLTWLGGGLLALAAARWLPWPGAPLALGVGLIFWVGWGEGLFYGQADHDHGAAYVIPYVITRDEVGLLSSLAQGNLGWHAAYLLGLCLLALTAALAREGPRRRLLLVLGVPAALLTATAAWLQLP